MTQRQTGIVMCNKIQKRLKAEKECVYVWVDNRGEGGVRDDRQLERAAVKRPRQQVKHTKIVWQQLCHKIQGLVLSLSESEGGGGGSQELHVYVWKTVEDRDGVCDSWCVCVWWRVEGLRGKRNSKKPPKSLSCVIGAVPLSPRYLHAQAGYRFLCSCWLCNRHRVTAAPLWPSFRRRFSQLNCFEYGWEVNGTKMLCLLLTHESAFKNLYYVWSLKLTAVYLQLL